MNWLQTIFGFLGGSSVSKALDYALERTEDVDKRNALVLEYYRMKEETKRAELAKVTVPWVDAVHKMGRQIMILVTIVGMGVLLAMGKGDVLREYSEFVFTVLGLGGGYVALKGKGQ